MPPRPPVLCPGCAHRGIFYALHCLNVNVMGDIGCYTLGALPPLLAMDSCVCMGASVGMGVGMDKVSERGRTVAVVGDSTFIHAGVPAVIDMAWNRSAAVLIILDNRCTAMTGRQPTAASSPTGSAGRGTAILPASGTTGFQPVTSDGQAAAATAELPPLDLARLCRAAGIEDVAVVDPYQLDTVFETLRRALASDKPSVILTNRPCGLLAGVERRPPLRIESDLCQGCLDCARLACPALVVEDDRARIVEELCRGCTLCMQVCKFGSVVASEDKSAT